MNHSGLIRAAAGRRAGSAAVRTTRSTPSAPIPARRSHSRAASGRGELVLAAGVGQDHEVVLGAVALGELALAKFVLGELVLGELAPGRTGISRW